MPNKRREVAPLHQFVRERTERGTPEECWVWRGAYTNKGAPAIQLRSRDYEDYDLLAEFGIDYDTKNPAVRRIVYGLTFGSVPFNMMVFNNCDNSRCVNPAHMYLGDTKATSEVRDRRGNLHRGQQVRRAVLTDQQAREIFVRIQALEGRAGLTAIAREYNVTLGVIMCIKKGDSWRSITGAALPEATRQTRLKVRKARRKGSRFATRD